MIEYMRQEPPDQDEVDTCVICRDDFPIDTCIEVNGKFICDCCVDDINEIADERQLFSWPCQQLHGGTGEAIYASVNGMCTHKECHPKNDDRR